MAHKVKKGKRQFCGNAPIVVTHPEPSEAGYAYSTGGPDGMTVHDVAVMSGARRRAAGARAENADAFQGKRATADARELRNIRATLVALGPSLPGCNDVLA